MDVADAAGYLAFPALAALFSGVLAIVWAPSIVTRSYIQHFAAGVVLAAVVVEVLPEVTAEGARWSVAVAFALGSALMVGLKWGFERLERRGVRASLSLFTTAVIDTFIDGLVIGVGFALAHGAGRALSLALGVELFFLGLAVAVPEEKSPGPKWMPVAMTGGLAVVLLLGALLGLALGGLGGETLAALLAFGAAALLYLVMEELLVEAHEHGDVPLTAGALFAGFLLFFAYLGF